MPPARSSESGGDERVGSMRTASGAACSSSAPRRLAALAHHRRDRLRRGHPRRPLSQPPADGRLYVGLDRADVNRIGLALGEAGIDFDVNSDGTTVLVGRQDRAGAHAACREGSADQRQRRLRAVRQVGSLGLTSFMQQVTRVRALEGEIARTIQSINGIKAARVHIVMAERGRSAARSSRRPPPWSSAASRQATATGAVDPPSGRRRRARA